MIHILPAIRIPSVCALLGPRPSLIVIPVAALNYSPSWKNTTLLSIVLNSDTVVKCGVLTRIHMHSGIIRGRTSKMLRSNRNDR